MNAKLNPLLRGLYGVAAAMALFTGFGNMPLWKRYYVADVPGLGWSGDFFVNVTIHILAGSVLLAIGAYAITGSLMARKSLTDRLTFSGKIRGVLLALALVTGILMVVKNLPGVNFSMMLLMIFNFTHLAAAMLFMIATLVAMIFRQRWS